MPLRLRALVLVGLALAPGCRSTGSAALPPAMAPPAQPDRATVREGEALYLRYCASCHGVSARGDGPAADALTKPPADLTRLGARFGVPLPRERIADDIDGRQMVSGHGTREMPVWGRRLYAGEHEGPGAEETPGGRLREEARRGTLLLILDYLDALQRPDGPPAGE